jgi:hypothetical protein
MMSRLLKAGPMKLPHCGNPPFSLPYMGID